MLRNKNTSLDTISVEFVCKLKLEATGLKLAYNFPKNKLHHVYIHVYFPSF